MTWLVVQHVAWEGPGLIAAEALRRGLSLDVRRMDRGESLPGIEEISGLVVMGGPMAVYEAEDHPHLQDEARLMRAAAERGLPVLGVCLGSQLLAAALGARVFKGPVQEVGLGEATLTSEGLADPVLGPSGPRLSVIHWHGDTFDLPKGATRLALSDAYPNQAFRLGKKAYAFQFHVETDAVLAREWNPRLPPSMRLAPESVALVEQVGAPILKRFFEAVL
jgi:GMP synthase (glutamine-hydrolysing)